MKTDWQSLSFEDVVSDESGGNIKTLQSEFQAVGRFPIVDQGKELIAGYTDDPDRVCKAPLPVIVFGDHTRCFKFVDFPFCMGADGVKVLRPRIEMHEKYLFHYLRSLHLPNAGYDRHFKYLKRTKVKLPPLAEQRRIATILDQTEALRAKRRQALAQLDTLTQSLFFDLFGGRKFPEESIGDLLASGNLLHHKDGNHGSLYPRSDDFGETGVPFLSAKAITDDGRIDEALVEWLREDKASQLRIGWIASGDVLLAHNASVGKVALYDGRFERALIGTSLTAFRPNPVRVDSQFLAAALCSPMFQRQLEKNMGQTTRNQVPITAQRELCIIAPPLPLQREFAAQVSAVERLKTSQWASLAKLDVLFASLQHRAFQGEL